MLCAPPESYDAIRAFYLDAKPAKATARQMMKMVTALNAEVAGIGDPAPAGGVKITCFTCHRGAVKPLTAPGGGD